MSHLKAPAPILSTVKSSPCLAPPRPRPRSHSTQGILPRSRKPRKYRKTKKPKTPKTPDPSRGRSIPRKLGPRDIGRISYKGTKIKKDAHNSHFLDEKIHRKARRADNRNTKYNRYHKNELSNGYVLIDSKKRLKPIDWSPLETKDEHDSDTSDSDLDYNIKTLIEALPTEQRSKLQTIPTDHDTKITFLKDLRQMVMIEVKRLHIEDKELEQLASRIDVNNMEQCVDDEKRMGSLHGDKNSTMTLDIDIDDAIDAIGDDEEDVNVKESVENKYKKMLQRNNNKMGLFQRKLLTMHVINELTDLIDHMEDAE